MVFLDAVASPSTYPLSVSGSMSESVIVTDLEIAIASQKLCELIRSALTCDVGTLEAVTWQPVGGAVYMQNLAINSVKCLPEPQIRRQDCHHRLKSLEPERRNSKLLYCRK